MPAWNEFAWATFLYGALGNDRDYQDLMGRAQFLSNLRTDPNAIQATEIRQKFIKEFLNRWRSRVQNNPQSARAIQTTIQDLLPYLHALKNLVIETVNFEQMVDVRNVKMTVSQVIEYCYTAIRKMGFRFGPTATSKLLHVLQPGLFVMWDNAILDDYKKKNKRISDSNQGYRVYLHIMQQVATSVHQEFQKSKLDSVVGPEQGPARYLSEQMNYHPPKTLAKYLDEYNWVTITKQVQVPPSWHP